MTQGEPAGPLPGADGKAAPDSGDVLGLGAAGLTITFGFGPGLFTSDGKDRYGLATRRPAALVDLPRFNGDQLIPRENRRRPVHPGLRERRASGVPCRAATGAPALRRRDDALGPGRFPVGSARSDAAQPDGLQGRHQQPVDRKSRELMNQFVWANGADAPWMQGGTYTRRAPHPHHARTLGQHRSRFPGTGVRPSQIQRRADRQEERIRRRSTSKAQDKDGNPVIPENSHVRLSNQATNNGAQILRRSYSYNDGTNFYIERWPPWRQETEYDAGLIFIAHQSDPRTGFIPINEKLAKFDMMNQFTTHVGSAVFACPPGAKPGSYIGAGLFET